MLLCMLEDSAVGKEGDDDMSLYHASTKSRTIMMRMSFSEADRDGQLGMSGAKAFGDLWDHWDLVMTACQAAGVEKANGRATL